MIEIVPAILPSSFEDIAKHVSRVVDGVKRVQVDIVDGQFAPAKTWPYASEEGNNAMAGLVGQELGLPEWGRMEYELDMMIVDPYSGFEQWLDAGFTTLIPHREAASDDELYAIMRGCRARGASFGIAIVPPTSTSTLERWFKDVDFIQVMGSATIGRQGTPLSEAALTRIADIHAVAPSCKIAVDIGVSMETAPRLIQAGATKLVAGSAIWRAADPLKAIHDLAALGSEG